MSLPTQQLPPLWTIYAAQLDVAMWDYRPQDIADLMGIHIDSVRRFCQRLWPEWEGQYFLTYDEAIVLIQRIARDARKLPERADVYQRAQSAGVIDDSFPHGDERFSQWLKALHADRERRRRIGPHGDKVNSQ